MSTCGQWEISPKTGLAALQEVYNEELAGGSFEVDKIVIGGHEYLAADLVESAGPGI